MNIHLDKNFVDYSLWLEYVPVLTSGKNAQQHFNFKNNSYRKYTAILRKSELLV